MRWNDIRDQQGLRLIAAYSLLYVFVRLISAIPAVELAWAGLLFGSIATLVLADRIEPLHVVFPLILMQHSFTKTLAPSRNWIHGEFLFSVSMVHVVTLALLAATVVAILLAGRVRMDAFTLLILGVTIVATAVAEISIIRYFFIEFLILATVVVYSLYVQNVVSKSDANAAVYTVVFIPVGIACGSIVLFLVDSLFGTTLYNGYLVIQIFIIGILLGAVFEGKTAGRHTFWAILLILVGYLVVFVVSLLDSGTGTTKLLIVVAVTLLALVKQVRRRQAQPAAIAVGVGLLLLASVYLYVYYTTSVRLPLEFLVSKFLSVFTFDLYMIHHSPLVRILELMNIFAGELEEGVLAVAFGQGFGSYFTDIYYPFDQYVTLGPSDYPVWQIRSHRFYNPHKILGGYLLLKYGLAGVVLVGAIMLAGVRSYLATDGYRSLLGLGILLTAPLLGFGIKNSILLGVLIGLWARFAVDLEAIRDNI